jgi:ABC-type bacteriocin/lantibiotic exporter with double-glycine peptidase domain
MKENYMEPFDRFLLMLKKDKADILKIYTYAIFHGLVYLSLPLGIQSIINLIQGGLVSTSWIILVVFVISGVAITGVLQVKKLQLTEYLQQKIFTRAAFEFASRVPRIKMSEFNKHYAPELMNRFFDTITLQKGLSKILMDFSTASIQVVFGLILLSMYHPFFIVFSLILVLLVYSIFKLTAKKGLKSSLEESKNKYEVAHWLEELARTNMSFKLAGYTNLPLERINNSTTKYIDARETHFKILITQYIMMVIFKVLVATGLLAVGGYLVINQQMNIGQFVAAEIIILLVLSSVEKLILSLETIYDVLTAVDKIGYITDLEVDSDGGSLIPKEDSKGGLKVEIKNLSFKYSDNIKNTLNHISLDIDHNERLMISGKTDSGKSTLINILSGVYSPQSGFLSYNDLPLGNLNLMHLHSLIGDCLMVEDLFEGTLYENISMGRPDATFENVQWAVKSLGLDETIKSLPKGYETRIKPLGQQFSKGVVSKIILARSIADKPKLLLVKDLFATLPYNERNQIFDFLISDKNKWTLVVSSSDVELAKKMDQILIIKDGEILKKGNYEEVKNLLF